MAAPGSDLSAKQLDFVVSVTQASINSGMLEYLSQDNQPVNYWYFLVDDNEDPQPPISKEAILELTKTDAFPNGVDPFDIPAGTNPSDPRLQLLLAKYFGCAVCLQLGLPPGVLPKTLSVVELGMGATDVTFNMYCSQFIILELSPGRAGPVWNVYQQPSGTAWYLQSEVSIIGQQLANLDTTYFNKNPEQKNAIQAQLDKMSGEAFSLQQLLYDLENAKMQTLSLEGVPTGGHAYDVMSRFFIELYAQLCKDNGQPLINVNVTTEDADLSQMSVTSAELQVTQPKDGNGDPISGSAATTLDYLCMTNQRPLPPTLPTFEWTWVHPAEISEKSGIMSISRSSFATYLGEQLKGVVGSACATISISNSDPTGDSWWENFDFTIQTGQAVNVTVSSTAGPQVLSLQQSSYQEYDFQDFADRSITTQLTNTYTCAVSFVGSTVTIIQRLLLTLYVEVVDEGNTCKPYDTTLTDVYTLSVDQSGDLQAAKTSSNTQDNADVLNPDENPQISGCGASVAQAVQGAMSVVSLTDIPIVSIQSFIFPGANVFTYKDVGFSNFQDLVCSITYVAPDDATAAVEVSAELPSNEQQNTANQAAQATTTLHTNQPNNQSSSSTLSLAYSCELMQNYVQGEIVAPQSKFEALQTDDGHSILFAINTDNVLCAVVEQSAETSTGWTLTDLSSAAIATAYPDGTVRTFDVGQSVVDGTIGIAMAVTSGGADHLFVSLFNPNTASTWSSPPTWTQYPFDDPNPDYKSLTVSVTGIWFSETVDKQQYIIVDIVRDPQSAVNHVLRFCIDPSNDSQHWQENDVSSDFEVDSYQSCMGRRNFKSDTVDGIYTRGLAGDSSQLMYTPVINVWGEGPPLPTLFSLPAGVGASAITACRNADLTSDLYVTGGSSLYWFASTNQQKDAVAQLLFTDNNLAGTSELYSMNHQGVITIWGRNSDDAVYYTACPEDQVSNTKAWSPVVPIAAQIERACAYVNRLDGGNTIFTSGAGQLQRLVQGTDPSQIWQTQELRLAQDPLLPSLSFKSYTTTLKVTDASNQPVQNSDISLSATTRTPFYLNGLYYVLGTTAVTIQTDSAGLVTLIQDTQNISGTIITATLNGVQTVVNPMDTVFQKIAPLNTADKLQAASYPSQIVAGGTQGPITSTPLVKTSSDAVGEVASNLGSLQKAYDSVNSPAAQRRAYPRVTSLGRPALVGGIVSDIIIGVGDLFRWLETGVEATIELVEDAATSVWHFLATIGDFVYHAVLDTVEAVVGAVVWVFNAIKTAIEDIIQFVEFLFEWDDIKRTKDIFTNMTKFYVGQQISQFDTLKSRFDANIQAVEGTLNSWAGITDWSPLGDAASKSASSSSSNISAHQTSGSQLFVHHAQNQAGNAVVQGDVPTVDALQNLIDDMLTALTNEGEVLSAVYQQLLDLSHEFQDLSLSDIIKKVAVILVDGILSSAQVVVDALFDVLSNLGTALFEFLDIKIYIPILSDILSAIGIPEISYLDLLMWVSAVGYTIIHKIIKDTPPFPNDSTSSQLIAATDWAGFSNIIQSTANNDPALESNAITLQVQSPIRTLSPLQSEIFTAGHGFAGFSAFVGDILSILEAAAPVDANPFGTFSAIMNLITASLIAGSNYLAPRDPIANEAVTVISDATSVLVILSSIAFSGPAQKKFAASPNVVFQGLAVGDGRATGAIIDSILIFPALVCTCWHFYELSQDPASDDKTAAILGEISNLCSYISRLMYTNAVNNNVNPAVKEGQIVIMGISNFCVAGLQLAEGLGVS